MPDPRFPFSNFLPAEVEFGGRVYPTVEHAYQAAKTKDPHERAAIQRATTPGQAKRMGQHLSMRKNWDEIKLYVMRRLLVQKFAPGTPYAEQLVQYKGRIVEWNTWHDNYWGICTCPRCPGAGTNYLGHILMRLRLRLKSGANF